MQPKNKITAAMLAFFTGFVGGHKLYLGKTGGFIGFMILFIVSINVGFPISLIAGVMNGIKLLNMSDQDFDRQYNRGYNVVRRGPLEVRREQQMQKYEQIPGYKSMNQSKTKISPQNAMKANPFKASGIKKYKDFDLDDAILDFKKGLEISPNDVALHFNIACAYSLTEKKSLAYHHLQRAVMSGLKDVERILSHDDLAYVRIQPEYEAFRASGFTNNPFKVQNTAEKTQNEELTNSDPNVVEDVLLAQLNKIQELKNRFLDNNLLSCPRF
jgi:TM2 domain-containing membrane protein YozV